AVDVVRQLVADGGVDHVFGHVWMGEEAVEENVALLADRVDRAVAIARSRPEMDGDGVPVRRVGIVGIPEGLETILQPGGVTQWNRRHRDKSLVAFARIAR